MTHKIALLALMLALPALAAESRPAQPPAPAEPASGTTADAATVAFAEAVASCTQASFEAPHPFVRGFVIQHRILGTSDGVCSYTQTMPGDMRMECALTDEGREALSQEFHAQASGRMSGSTARQPVWTGDCEIIDKTGKATPMQGG